MPKNILMPALSPTMKEGNIVKWLKKEGDQVKDSEVIAEIETDKATMEVESIDDGVLAKILIPEGTENVLVNTPIAVITEIGEKYDSNKTIESEKPQTITTNIHITSSNKDNNEPIHYEKNNRIFATPLAKRIASQNNIEISNINGSGPNGRILKTDVEQILLKTTNPSQPCIAKTNNQISVTRDNSGFPEHEVVKISSMRKTIAKRLTESKQLAPHFYLTIECNIDALLTAKDSLNSNQTDVKLTINDFIIKAVANTLIKTPKANAAWFDDGIHMFKTADIAVAVAIEDGLITPVIRSVERLNLSEISFNMKSLTQKAKTGSLKQEEFQGGTFTISNLGMYGITNFSAIINPPQGCILAIGTGIKKPIVQNNKVEIGTMLNCTLSVDHRVVDGVIGAEFLKEFKKNIENPIMMLL